MPANTYVKRQKFYKTSKNKNNIFYNNNFKNKTDNKQHYPSKIFLNSCDSTSNKSYDNSNNSKIFRAFAIVKRDTTFIPLYNNTLTNVIINKCLQIAALLDTGASV